MESRVSLTLYVIVVIIFLISICVWGFKEWTRSITSPKTVVEAQVVEICRRSAGTFSGPGGSMNPIYRVTFLLLDEEQKTFDVPVRDYRWILIGDKGDLTVQGSRFIRFQIIEVPKVTVEAEIVEICRDNAGLRGEISVFTGESTFGATYEVTFLLSDNESVRLALPVRNYKGISVGDKGNLTMQGVRFVSWLCSSQNDMQD